MSKSKSIGTRGESQVVRYLFDCTGIEGIHRRELKGSKDIGDVIIEPFNIILEIKSGKQTQNYSRGRFEEWVAETRAELSNSKAEAAFLIINEYGRPLKDSKVFRVFVRLPRSFDFQYLDSFAQELAEDAAEKMIVS